MNLATRARQLMKQKNAFVAKQLGAYFATVNVIAYGGKGLKIVSDGRGGNGFTHARHAYIGKKLVASINSSGRYHDVTLAKNGKLRGVPVSFESKSGLDRAVDFLLNSF